MAPIYKEMSLQLWKRALGLLLGQLQDGVLPWGSLTIVAEEIGVAHSTICRLWRQVYTACEQSLIITPEIASQNNSRANGLRYSHVEFRQGLKEIPQHCCKTYHSTAKAMGVALSTVQRMLLHRDVCQVHMSSLRPTLSEENKMSRMELVLSFIDKKTQASSRTWRISFTLTRNGFISRRMDSALSLWQTRRNPTGMFNTSCS